MHEGQKLGSTFRSTCHQNEIPQNIKYQQYINLLQTHHIVSNSTLIYKHCSSHAFGIEKFLDV